MGSLFWDNGLVFVPLSDSDVLSLSPMTGMLRTHSQELC